MENAPPARSDTVPFVVGGVLAGLIVVVRRASFRNPSKKNFKRASFKNPQKRFQESIFQKSRKEKFQGSIFKKFPKEQFQQSIIQNIFKEKCQESLIDNYPRFLSHILWSDCARETAWQKTEDRRICLENQTGFVWKDNRICWKIKYISHFKAQSLDRVLAD